MNERFSFLRKRERAQKSKPADSRHFSDMLMELEQRIAFDAAAAEHVEAAAERQAAPPEQAPQDFSALAKALEARGNTTERQPERVVGSGSGAEPAKSPSLVSGETKSVQMRTSEVAQDPRRGALAIGNEAEAGKLRASIDVTGTEKSQSAVSGAGAQAFRESHTNDSSDSKSDVSHEPGFNRQAFDELSWAGSADGQSREIAFVAADVEDKDALIASLGRDIEVVVLDPSKDGVEQIAEVLRGRTNIDAIHILSHGGEGQLNLGTATLNATTMQGEYLDELTLIGQALSADGDILIYGCDFTAGDAGLQAAIILGGITGADIAASTDTTGHADLGGDWDLETHVGVIDTIALDASDWQHALVQTTINPTGGSQTTGSDGLRIFVTNLGQLQVRYKNLNQFYEPNTTDTSTSLYNGIYLAYGNRILGPNNGATNILDTAWQSAGAQSLTGSGTEADPYIVTTRVFYNIGGGTGYDAGTDLLVQIQTVYAFPNAYFTQNVTVTPPTANGQVIKYYHAMDTYLAGGDNGPAFSLDPSLAINNITNGDPSYVGVRKGIGTSTEAIVGFAEVEGSRQFDRYYSAHYNGMYASMDNGGDLANTWNTNPATDNGIAVQFTLGAINTPQTFSYRIAFDGDTTLDLDANNSTATGTSYAGTFQATTGSEVSVVDTDVDIVNVIGGIADATVTLNNPQSGDVLTVDESALPAGISVTVHSAYSVTIAGVADAAAYEVALQAIKFSTTSGVTSVRNFTVALHNQLNSETTTATSTLSGNFSPIVDLNSGLTGIVKTNNIITNGDFADYADRPYGWTEGGTGTATDSAITGRYAFTSDSAATLTQAGLTGLNAGPGLNGAGQLTFDLGWVNSNILNSRTLDIQVGGTTYARLTTGVAGTGGTITYLNGATNAAGTTASTSLTAIGSGSGTLTSITINLPASVAASGSLVFSASNAGDDIYVDNVLLRTNITSMVDATPGSNWNATYTENGPAVSISDTDNDVRDGDSANMVSGLVTISNAQTGDRLLVNGSAAASGTVNGISYTNNGTTVTLTGSATRANYAAAIRAISFDNTTDNPGSVTRDITVRVNDGTANSNIAHSFITVVPVNDAPVDGNETNTVTEDTTLTVSAPGVLSNATDPDGDTLTVSQFTWNSVNYAAGVTASIAGVGQLTLNANGSYTFVPVANFTGTIPVVTYTVSDGNGGTDTSTLTLTMLSVNDAPAGTNNTITTNEDTPYTFAAADFGFTDPNDAPANAFESVIITTLPTGGGTLLLNGVAVTAGQVIAVASIPQLTYTPPANGNGVGLSSFTFQVRDNGGTANGGQNTDQSPNTITFNVTSVNDAPAGTNNTITTAEDTAYTFAAADFGFSDPNDVPANAFESVVITTLPASGTLRLNGIAVAAGQVIAVANIPQLTYTPPANGAGVGLASFTFQVRDNGGTANGGQNTDQSPNTITFNVTSINDAPAGTNNTITAVEDTAYTFAAADFGFTDPNDTPPNAFESVIITTLPANGTLRLNGVAVTAGQVIVVADIPLLTYTAPANLNGAALTTFTFQVRDNGGTANGGQNTDQTPNTITVNVTAINDAPVNTLPAQSGNEDAGIPLAGLAVTDIDAGSGNIQVTLSVPSGQGTLSATAGGGVAVTGSGSNTLVLTGTLASINTYLATAGTRPVFNQAVADFNGTVSLTMTTSDLGNTGTGGALTDTDTVQITILPVVDIANDSVSTNEDTAVAISPFANDTFENGGRALTAINGSAIVAGGAAVAVANGTVSLSADGNTLTFTPATNYNGATSFTYTVTSGGVTETATVNVTVNAINDAPVNTAPPSYAKAEDDGNLQLIGLSISDADAGTSGMTVTLSVPSGSGTLTASNAGGVTVAGSGTNSLTLSGSQAAINAYLASASAPAFVQVADFNGTVNVTMTTSDLGNTGAGGAQTAVTVVPINISAVADINGDTIAATEDTPITFNVITGTNGATADSFENPGRIISAVNGSAFTPGAPIAITGGIITVMTGGTVVFTPNADYSGSTSFTYTVTSGGVTETATVTINVAAVNDAPVNTLPGAQTTAEDVPLAISGISVADVDSATLTTTLTIPAGAGALAVTALPGGATVTGSGTATVQISGTAAQINAVLASLTYTPTADFNNGPAGSFSLGVTTSDGSLSASNSVSVRVTPVADIVDDVVQTSEDTSVSFNVLTGLNEVSGADNFEGPRTVTAINGTAFVAGTPIAVTGGSIVVQSDGSVVFTPTGNFSGTTTFTYSVSAGGGSTPAETATVTITTSAVNDAPVNTLPASYTVAEDGSLKLTGLSVADVDIGAGVMTVTLSIPSGSGSLTATNGGGVAVTGSGTATLVLTGTLANINAYLASASAPDFVQVADFNGSVTLTMTSNDGGATGTGGPLSDTDSVTINITPVVDIADDTVATNEDTPVDITPLANDSFENAGRQITAINGSAILAGGAAIAVANGTVSMAADGITLTFTPNANYNGPTTFQYTVTSGGVTETATVTVNVTAVNDAPVNSYPSSYTTPEDSPLHLTGLSIADADAGSSDVTVTLSVPSGAGSLQAVNGAGVTVAGSGTNSITLTGTVTAINTYLASAAAPTYTQAPADFNGTVQLTMVTNDGGATGGPALSDTDTIPIIITPVTDIQDDSVSTDEDTPLTFNVITGAGGASADSFEGTPVVTQINGASFTPGVPIAIAGGTITVQANGAVLFNPSLDYNGTSGFTYTVTSGGVTETATVTITVVAENDAPVVTAPIADRTDNDSETINLDVSGNFSDVDNPTLIYSATGLPVGLSINQTTGVISGTIAASASMSDPYTVTVTATDAGGLSVSDTFIWTVINPAPTAGNDTNTVTEDITLNVPAVSGLLSNDTDPDGDVLAVTNFTLAGNPTIFTAGQTATIAGVGSLTIRADGSYTFVPAPNYNGSVPLVTYTVSDGEGGIDTATLALSITAVDDPQSIDGLNDGPVAGTDAEVNESDLPSGTNPSGNGENASGTFTITTADGVTSLSVGGPVISYAQLLAAGTTPIAIPTLHGTLTINGYDASTGTVSYAFTLTSSANHSGGPVVETIALVLTDGDGDTTSGTLGILINDDAPIANDDTDATINVSGNPSSIAGGNVLTGLDNPAAPDADPADGTADVPGADGGLTITAVGIGLAAPTPGNVDAFINGSYGTFRLDAAGNYVYTPDYSNPTVMALTPPATLTETFRYVVTDADGSTATATVTITINGTPTVLGLGDGPVAGTDGNVLESDLPNGTNPVGTGETLIGEFRAIAGRHGMDAIIVEGQTISNAQLLDLATNPVTIPTTHGSLTLTGFDAVSGEVTYSYTLTGAVTHPATGLVTDDIDIGIRDGLGNFSDHVLRINIVDDAPIAANDTNAIVEDDADNTVDGNVLANDSAGADVDATPVTAVSAGTGAPSGAPGSTVNGTYGALVLNADGTYVYTLDNSRPATTALTSGQIVTEVFTYQITDADGDSATATLTVTITGSNDAPTVVAPIADQSDQDGAAVSIDISGAFADVDSPTLTYALAPGSVLPAGLVLNATTGVISGTIDNSASQGGAAGVYTIGIIASDGQGGSTQDTFTWTVGNPVPVAVNDTLTVGENATGSGNALGNDSDPDGDALSVVGVGLVANPFGGVGSAVAGSNGGQFTVNADGSYTFNPGTSFDDLAPGEQRVTTINYQISDGEGGFAVATITVTVNGANDAPQAVNDSDSTVENVNATGNVLANDVDVDNDPADLEVRSFMVAGDATIYTAGSTATIAGVGTIVINSDGSYTFDPVPNYYGAVPVITYTMADGPASDPNSLTDDATLSINVSFVNDDPNAVNDAFPVVEDTPVTGNVLANDTDIDGDTLTVSGFTIGATAYLPGDTATITGVGTFLLNANGAFTFTPAPNYFGPVPVITYTASDGQGGTDTATLTLGPVSPVNDAPVAQNDAFATDQNTAVNGNLFADNGSGADVDVDDPLAVALVNGVALSSGSTITLPSGALLVVNADGTFSYDPNGVFDSLPEGQIDTDSFTYTVRDPSGEVSTATVTISITGLDDAISITGLNDGPNNTDGAVNESDLPNGSTPAGTGEVLNGTLTLTAVDGIGALSVNGIPVTVFPTPGNPLIFNGTYGIMRVTAFNAATGLLTYEYTLTQPADQSGGLVTDDFVIELTDRDGDVVNGTLSIQINDDQPTANPDANSIIEDTVTLVTGNVLANDVLGADRTNGEVSAVSFGATPGTVGSALTSAYGFLTLNADGSYSYSLDNANPLVQGLQQGQTLTEVFSYTYTDGDGDAVTSTLTITISGRNDVPVANNDSVAVTEDIAASGNVLTNDVDVDGDTLVVSGFTFGGTSYTAGQTATIAGVGSLVINANGSFTFTPAPNYNGAVPSAGYTISDGHGGTSSATLAIGPIIPVNDAPINTVPGPQTVSEDAGPVLITGVSIADPDTTQVLTTVITIPPATGSLAASGGVYDAATGVLVIIGTPAQINSALATLTYTPLADFNTGGSSFTVTMVTDDGEAPAVSSTFTIAVTPVADIVADTVTTNEDTVLTFNPISGSGGAEADNFENAGAQISSITQPAIGTAALNGDGTITYTPPANYNGTTTMTYTVTSGGVTETATITITVASVNDAPVAQNDAFATDQNTAVNGNLFADNGSGADVDVDDPLAVALVNGVALSSGSTITLPSGALLVVNADGTFSYDPNGVFDSLPEGQVDTDSFTYTVRDPSGEVSTATVTISITGLDDAISITGLNDGPNNTDGAVNESDLPNGSTPAGTGEVLNGTLTLTAVDGIGALSVNGIPVTVFPTPGNPLIFNGAYGIMRVTAFNAATGLLTYEYTLTQPADQSGGLVTDDFVIELTDRDGDVVNGTLSIQINDDQPTANPDANSIIEDTVTPVTGNVLANDVLGADRTNGEVSAVSFGATPGTVGSALTSAYGFLTLNADGSYSYSLDNANPLVQGLQQGQTLTEVFSYTYTDGDGDAVTSTLTITISGRNNVPVANNDSVAVTEDIAASGNVLTNDVDVDGDTLVVSGFTFGGTSYTAGQTATIAGVGSLVINANGSFTFTPAPNYNGAVPSAGYTISDGHGGTSSATLAIGPIIPVNDVPVAVNDIVPVMEDTPVSGNLLSNDTDADGDTLQVTGFTVGGNTYGPGSLVNIPGVGELTIAADGAFSFTPDLDYNGPVPIITYTVSDGNGGTASASLVLGPVVPQNDPPVAVNDSFPVVEDTPVSGNVLANDTDPDGDPLRVAGFSVGGRNYAPGQTAVIPGVGTVLINANGGFTFAPAPNYNGPVPTITYTVVDDDGATDTATLTLGPVSPVNDAPVARSDTATGKGGDTIRIPVLANDGDVDGDRLQIVAINGVPVTVGVPVSITNGVVTLNADGTISFVPDIGYSGPVSFSYTVSDGNGGFDTASVSVDVQAGYLEIDPPFVPPHLPNNLLPLTSADGMVGVSLGDLNGTSLSVDGMIDGVANSIRYLNGISGLSADGPVGQVVHQIDRWLYTEDRLAGLDDAQFDGGSAFAAPEGREGTWFMVDTIIRDGLLQVSILAANGRDGVEVGVGRTVTLADGRALPAWIEIDKGGMLIGRPPAGLGFIELKIQAVDSENRTIEDKVRIDLLTGVVVSHVAEQRAEASSLLFSGQSMLGMEIAIQRANSLADALSGWSELRDETRIA